MGFLAAIIGRVELDGSGFAKGAKYVEGTATRMANNVGARMRNLVSAALLSYAIKSTVNYGSQLVDLSKRLDVSVESLQEFGYAAKQNGSNLEKFVAFLEKLNDTRAEILSGSKTGMELFEKAQQFGITKNDLTSKRIEEIVKTRIAPTIQSGDMQKLIGPLRDIGGRGAGELAAAFKDGLDEAAKEARDKGLIMAEEQAAALDRIGDAFDTLKQSLLVGFAPVVVKIAEAVGIASYMIRAEWERVKNLGKAEPVQKTAMTAEALVKIMQIFTTSGNPIRDTKELLAIINRPTSGKSTSQTLEEGQAAADKVYAELAAFLENLSKGIPNPPKTEFKEPTTPEEKEQKFKTESERLSVDSLNRMGGFVGGAEITILSVQREIAKNTREIANNTKPTQSGRGSQPLVSF